MLNEVNAHGFPVLYRRVDVIYAANLADVDHQSILKPLFLGLWFCQEIVDWTQ